MLASRGQVRPGVEVFLQRAEEFRGHRLGLVTNAAAVTRDLRWVPDALQEVGLEVVALFTPEHGLYAAAADGVEVPSFYDEEQKRWVYSLYGPQRKPSPQQLAGLDALLYDLPDVGARFYTYIWTLSLVIEACGEVGLPLHVLDRPNPITGLHIEGPGVEEGFETFVGRRSIPIRHGWTSGEFARWYNETFACNAPLTVWWAQGWRRSQWWDETGLPWVSPSPAMATLETATLYPGTCLFEGVNLSEGRGTPHPFEWLGAPWVKERAVAQRLNALSLPGVVFRPLRFVPWSGPFVGQVCAGVQVHVTDREAFRPVHTGVCALAAFLVEDPERFQWQSSQGRYRIDRLWGGPSLRETLSRSRDPLQVAAEWDTASDPTLEQTWRCFWSEAYGGEED